MKSKIIEILKKYEYDPASGYDSNERVIDSDDFSKIADELIKLLNLHIVSNSVCRCKRVSEVKISRDGKPWCRTCGNLLRQTDC